MIFGNRGRDTDDPKGSLETGIETENKQKPNIVVSDIIPANIF